MDMTNDTSCEFRTQSQTPSLQSSTLKRRGRPKLNISWPAEEFTFTSLNEASTLSSSSLRKKMRYELVKGGLVKTGTLKTAFGRPQNLYKKVTN